MKPAFFPVIMGGRRGSVTQVFSPASLFTSGVQGAWYDPSDYTSLFQDSAGTTPVTAVEQPVGLMLDKSQGLVLGSELVTGAASAYSGNGTVATVGDTVTATCTTNGIYGITWLSTFVSNLWVVLTVEVVTNSASKSLLIFPNGNSTALAGGTTTGSKSFIALAPTATGSTRCPIFYINGLVGESFSVRLVSIKSLAGNHASQATSASRPVLRARYNLLTYSEQFDNAVWTNVFVTRSANAAVAPDGTTTGDLLYPASSGNSRGVYQRPTLSSGTFVTTIYAKAAGKSWVSFIDFGGGLNRAWANVSTGAVGTVNAGYSLTITAAENGWYRLDFTQTAAVANPYVWITIVDSDNNSNVTVNGTDGIYLWGADLRTGSSAGTYQRIAAATDYATAGFLPYLAFDGSDDHLLIANTDDLNFGQGSFWAQTGLTSLGASQYDVIWGKNSLSNDNIRLFLISNNALGVFWGSDAQSYAGSSNTITKNTPQIQEWGVNSSGPTAFYAVNGTESTPAITLSGTGSNSAPAYLGISNNLSQYQTQMNLYGMILRKGTLPTAAQRTESRNWMAAKSGAVL